MMNLQQQMEERFKNFEEFEKQQEFEEKQKQGRQRYLERKYESGNFVDIAKIKYEIRKVKNRKKDNILRVETKKLGNKSVLIINDKEILEMKYKENLNRRLEEITFELEHQMKVTEELKRSREFIIGTLDEVNEMFFYQ